MQSLADAVKQTVNALEEVNKDLTSAYQDTLMKIGESLVFFTPIDTGVASSNWNVGRSSVAGQISAIREVEAGEKGKAALDKITSQIKSLKLGDPVVFSNPVDYIDELEGGKSRQAPAGMVTPTVFRVDDIWLESLEKYKIN